MGYRVIDNGRGPVNLGGADTVCWDCIVDWESGGIGHQGSVSILNVLRSCGLNVRLVQMTEASTLKEMKESL